MHTESSAVRPGLTRFEGQLKPESMSRFSCPARLAVGLALGFLAASLAMAAVPGDAPATNAVDRPKLWFPVGEELIYRIYWGIIPVGMTRATTEWVEEDGKTLLAIRYRTISNKVVEKIYPVDDTIESIVDPVPFRSVRYTKKLSEGHYRTEEVTRFDYDHLMAHWENKLKSKTREFAIQKDTRDIVAFMYYMRSQAFTVGERTHYQVMSDEKLYDLWINVTKKEDVKLPGFGSVASLRVDPEAAFQGFFVRKGKASIWVSDDTRRVCTKLVGSVPVANVKALLVGVGGPGDDFWTRKTREHGSDENVVPAGSTGQTGRATAVLSNAPPAAATVAPSAVPQKP